jgi:hypothetical protein
VGRTAWIPGHSSIPVRHKPDLDPIWNVLDVGIIMSETIRALGFPSFAHEESSEVRWQNCEYNRFAPSVQTTALFVA